MSSPAPVVMKFGGSSVADLERIRHCALRVVERAAAQPVVVVVSAMGKTTNELLAMARALIDPPPARELDMLLSTGERGSMTLLALAIAALGRQAISLTGSQCGIITDHQHGRARIVEVRPFRVLDELAAGNIVIIGGFQGVSYKRDVTTLGRGGSDTTAVALAAAIDADCEIYSDVDGVYSADPREVDGATRLDTLSYGEMQALARAGAKVLHSQAVQLAEERGIAIYARHSRPEIAGETIIRKNPPSRPGVRAVASDASIIRVNLSFRAGAFRHVPEAIRQLGPLGLRHLRIAEQGVTGLLSQAQRTDSSEALARLGIFARSLGRDLAGLECVEGLAAVSCVGAGLEENPAVVARAFESLHAADVPVREVHTDSHSLAFMVESGGRVQAVRALHATFIGRGGEAR
ncbi:aspartate kinase [Nannocystis radixulma]|uniref:Aspartokinase n=1 Tax=Nannocystis radixulma TaxID=2995305 RepID=A0ABT5BB89_9BACT|nr:aspartate kinase [Nannocystis radixulma]MDC0671398.1 aspartate kinase [Nannocystis radixulma]